MASARKKQDEKHLKILRELVSLQGNKQCFDCHQRGPTYVNMTIGSFVCTSCSGMLRGLTPPHRVKSISMASFTPEEIELIKSRGNEYCKRVWLGLYDPSHEQDAKDEQQIKDFMVAKYEKRRFYLDPSQAGVNAAKNGTTSPPPSSPALSQSSTRVSSGLREAKPLSSLVGPGVRAIVRGHHPTSSSTDNIHIAANDFTKMSSPTAATWLRDFGAKDPFSSSSPSLVATGNTPNSSSSSLQQPSFANFDNNPIFTSPTFQSSLSVNCDTVHPRYNTNRWSMPTPAALSSLGNTMMPLQGGISGASSSGAMPGSNNQPPSEDRYAALKDLDSLMKSSGGVGGGSMSSLENGGTHSDWALGTGSASPWAPQPTNASAFGGGAVFGSPSSSTLSSNASQNLFPASPPMEASAVPIVSANGTPGFAAGASFTSPSSNPFRGASLAVDPNSPWVPSSIASSGSPAVPLNPFQTNNSMNQVTWGSVGTAGMGMVPNGQHSTVAANGNQNFQSSQPFGVFSGSPLNSTVLPQYPAAKVWPPAGNPFLAGSRPTPQTHSSNPFL